jgi:hypothetical protein
MGTAWCLLLSSCDQPAGSQLVLTQEHSTLSADDMQSGKFEITPTDDEHLGLAESTSTPTMPFATAIPSANTTGGLDTEGPWLVYRKVSGLVYAVNADGSGRTELPIAYNPWTYPFYMGSSSLPIIAYIAGTNLPGTEQELVVLSLPDLEENKRVPLRPCLHRMQGCDEADPAYVYRAPVWSANGRYLAFRGEIDGSSTDIYIYDAESAKVRRLTTSNNQVGSISWSPDSRWVVYAEIPEEFRPAVISMWAASLHSGEVRLLYEPVFGRYQIIHGWLDIDRFLVSDLSMDAYLDLRVVDVSTGGVSTLLPGHFFEILGVDLRTNTIALLPDARDPENAIDEPGIYLLSPEDPTPVRVDLDNAQSATWQSDLGLFLTDEQCPDTEGAVSAFDTTGSISCVDSGIGNQSPDGSWTVLQNGMIEIFDLTGNITGKLLEPSGGLIIWRQDSAGFFVLHADRLYYVDLPAVSLSIVDNEIDVGNPPYLPHLFWLGK